MRTPAQVSVRTLIERAQARLMPKARSVSVLLLRRPRRREANSGRSDESCIKPVWGGSNDECRRELARGTQGRDATAAASTGLSSDPDPICWPQAATAAGSSSRMRAALNTPVNRRIPQRTGRAVREWRPESKSHPNRRVTVRFSEKLHSSSHVANL